MKWFFIVYQVVFYCLQFHLNLLKFQKHIVASGLSMLVSPCCHRLTLAFFPLTQSIMKQKTQQRKNSEARALLKASFFNPLFQQKHPGIFFAHLKIHMLEKGTITIAPVSLAIFFLFEIQTNCRITILFYTNKTGA